MKFDPHIFRQRPGIPALLKALGAHKGEARYVGGMVRDSLLGLDVSDLDMATIHQPDEVVRRLEAAGIKAVPTGISHGTVTAVSAHTVVEVTTLRSDVETDGRRARVAYTSDWREDAARRDFTINALFADPQTGEITDYFGGLDDLEAGHVRFIGDPFERIAEDHLRILRFFRFHARYGEGTPDADGLAASIARANDLMALSRERIADELLKLLALPDPVATVRIMQDGGIFRPVLPEIGREGVERLSKLVAFETARAIEPAAIRRLAALLPSDPTLGRDIAARLKLSNADRDRLVSALTGEAEMDPLALAYRLGKEQAIDRLALAHRPEDERAEAIARIGDWDIPTLPIKGGELIARGVEKGPAVAKTLREIEKRWIEAGFPTGKQFDKIVEAVLG